MSASASTVMGRAALLVPATTAAFWSWACSWGQQRGAAAEALGSSQGFPGWRQEFPGWRSVAYRSGAPSGLDWRRAGPRFAPARRDPPLSDAPAPGRWRERQAPSARPLRARSAQLLPLALPAGMAEQRCFRDRAGPNSRSSARCPATSQVREPLRRLSAWVFPRKIARPRWLQHRYKSRADTGRNLLASLAFSSRFLLLGDDHKLPFVPKSRRRADEVSPKERHPNPRLSADRLYLQDFSERHLIVRQTSLAPFDSARSIVRAITTIPRREWGDFSVGLGGAMMPGVQSRGPPRSLDVPPAGTAAPCSPLNRRPRERPYTPP